MKGDKGREGREHREKIQTEDKGTGRGGGQDTTFCYDMKKNTKAENTGLMGGLSSYPGTIINMRHLATADITI